MCIFGKKEIKYCMAFIKIYFLALLRTPIFTLIITLCKMLIIQIRGNHYTKPQIIKFIGKTGKVETFLILSCIIHFYIEEWNISDTPYGHRETFILFIIINNSGGMTIY